MATMDASQEFMLVKKDKTGVVPIYDGDGQLLKFATGALADAEARKLSVKLGMQVQPRRVYDKKWREREAHRMKDGTYRPLPWADAAWWKELEAIWKDHFPHVSVQKQALIAYTESDEKGAADVQTPIKPGRYLEKFFADKLDEYSRRDLCCVLASKFESQDLMFTDDPEEVEEIYTTGPNSCMSKSAKDYGVEVHPVRGYLAGDLQLAYLRRKGRVVARCIVWPDKKIHNNIYGDSALMGPVLKKAGFKQGSLVGAKIKKIIKKVGATDAVFVVPHVDGASLVKEDKDHLLLVNKADDLSIQIGSGSGKTEVVCRCPMCTTIRAKTKMAKFAVRGQDQMTCNACAERDGAQCAILGSWCLKAEMVEAFIQGRKRMVSTANITSGYIFRCAGDGCWHHTDDKVTLKDGTTWSTGYAKTHAVKCECGIYRPKATTCGCKAVEWPKVTSTLEWRV